MRSYFRDYLANSIAVYHGMNGCAEHSLRSIHKLLQTCSYRDIAMIE